MRGGGSGRNRTGESRICSPLPYQLGYGAAEGVACTVTEDAGQDSGARPGDQRRGFARTCKLPLAQTSVSAPLTSRQLRNQWSGGPARLTAPLFVPARSCPFSVAQ